MKSLSLSTFLNISQDQVKNIGINVLALYILELANYVLPLVIIPYLTRVLGIENFGSVAFAQGLIFYLVTVSEYGFNYSATRVISIHRNDIAYISKLCSNVWGAKLFLFALIVLLEIALWLSLPRLHDVTTLLVVLNGILLGSILFPTWLFQGMEKIAVISVINLFSRLLITAGIFIFVKEKSDTIVYSFFLSAQWLLTSFIAIFYAVVKIKIRPSIPHFNDVTKELKGGFLLFLSRGASMLFVSANTFILGLFVNNAIVGYFSVGERIVRAVLRLIGSITQAVYPQFILKAKHSKELTIKRGKQLFIVLACVGSALCMGLILGADFINLILVGKGWSPTISVIRILSVLLVVLGCSQALSTLLLSFEQDRSVLKAYLYGAVTNIFLAVLLASKLSSNGMAISVVCAEVVVLLILYADSKKKLGI